jgi:hypothetical protein
MCTCFSFNFETSKEGTGRAYPPTCNPPSKTNYIPSTRRTHPEFVTIWTHVDVANPQPSYSGVRRYTYHCVTLKRQPSMLSMGLLTKSQPLIGQETIQVGWNLEPVSGEIFGHDRLRS